MVWQLQILSYLSLHFGRRDRWVLPHPFWASVAGRTEPVSRPFSRWRAACHVGSNILQTVSGTCIQEINQSGCKQIYCTSQSKKQNLCVCDRHQCQGVEGKCMHLLSSNISKSVTRLLNRSQLRIPKQYIRVWTVGWSQQFAIFFSVEINLLNGHIGHYWPQVAYTPAWTLATMLRLFSTLYKVKPPSLVQETTILLKSTPGFQARSNSWTSGLDVSLISMNGAAVAFLITEENNNFQCTLHV